jgi:hypothetical protein
MKMRKMRKSKKVRITKLGRKGKPIDKIKEFGVPRTPREKITKRGWETIFKALGWK